MVHLNPISHPHIQTFFENEIVCGLNDNKLFNFIGIYNKIKLAM